MRFFSFVLAECLALAIWDTTHAWAIFFAVMGVVLMCLQTPEEFMRGQKPVGGTRNGAEPKGLIKARGEAFNAWPPAPGVYAEFCDQMHDALDQKSDEDTAKFVETKHVQ